MVMRCLKDSTTARSNTHLMLTTRFDMIEEEKRQIMESLGLKEEDFLILKLFDETVREWWWKSFYEGPQIFTPPQKKAIPLIHQGKNVLICSPTGSGKTLSAFISIINELFVLSKKEKLNNSVYCLYISPLKSLANDIQKSLEKPLSEIQAMAKKKGISTQNIKHAIRHGDVSSYKRSKMLKDTPHILNTTPESLSILLNSPKFREKLKTVKWVIVDEIHSLAGSKRGTHLSISLERLEELKKEFDEHDEIDTSSGSFVRIGCSATIEPLKEVGNFLAGNDRPVEIVDTRFFRKFDLKMICPVPDLIFTTPQELSDGLYETLHHYIQEHKNTLIFTNTRNGAERVLYNLRFRYPEHYNDENSGCHHGSMGKEGRIETEDRLKKGSLKVVTSSTSLELGIDMPYIDLVIQVGSPKSVAALLQRIGRAGHDLSQVVKGRIVVLDRDELIECAVMLQKGQSGFVDQIHIPKNCLDALCQHVFGMALNKPQSIYEVRRIIKRSHCYKNLKDEDFLSVIDYLSGKYAELTDKRVYAKIWYDDVKNTIGKRGKNARVIYFMNTGMIPDTFSCDVLTRKKAWVGNLDEKYMERLKKGDVFSIGGKSYRFMYRRGGKIYVDNTSAKPTIPNWISEKLPLSFDLGKNVLAFKGEMTSLVMEHPREYVIEHLQDNYPIDYNSARSIYEIFEQQIGYLGHDSISTKCRIAVEEILDKKNDRRIYYVLTNYGIKFNDGFSRMLAYLISSQKSSNIYVSITDTGFMISVPMYLPVDIKNCLLAIYEDNCEDLLKGALDNTYLLKSNFRVNASRSLMILRNYMGYKKSAKRQQVSSDLMINMAKRLDNFAVIKESYREIIEDKFEVDNIKEILRGIHSGRIDVVQNTADSPSPMAFGLASLGASDVVTSQDKLTLLKNFHKRVMEKIFQDKMAGEKAACQGT